jgi:cell division protein FtsI (penicillin-binding protein 3)
VCFAAAAGALEARVLYLQLVDRDFLSEQGADRHLRTVQIAAHRGPITDRNGEPLAVSTPVDSIWANPEQLKPALDKAGALAKALHVDSDWLVRRVTSNLDREFVYLKRDLPPSKAAGVLQLDIPGVGTRREYRRYYPAGEVAGHVIGFTDVDDHGQEGLELAYNYWLQGESGSKRVIQDRLGRVVGDVDLIKAARPGRSLRTSLDVRLQYLAYRELKRAIVANRAKSGSVVVLNPKTGEVLAMVNQPSFNPNDRAQLDASHYRNRAATDIFEPGSSFKPLVIAAALQTGRYDPSTIVDTSPGYLKVSGRILTQDSTNLGPISVTTILARSSDVGAAKIALDLSPQRIWKVLSGFGIGHLTSSGFPGESAGVLNDPQHWRQIGQATLAYGYGVSVTALQLARAYAAIANDGLLPPVSFLALSGPPQRRRVISAATAHALLQMLEVVVSSPHGTGKRAAVDNYTVAGKTGTSKKASDGGYTNHYNSIFAGIAPASDPRLVIVVVVHDPRAGRYYGGDVAAPVFSAIATGALRVLAVPPDALSEPPVTVVADARSEQ